MAILYEQPQSYSDIWKIGQEARTYSNHFFMPLRILGTKNACCLNCNKYGRCSEISNAIVPNSADPDQTASEEAVWSGSCLFAILTGLL